MRAALVSGFWGQNIGNAFFNLGGRGCLEAAGYDVVFVQDQPAYWTFRNEKRGNFKASFPLISNVDCDVVVLQGPLLTSNFLAIWKETLAKLRRNGTQWAILSGAFRAYTEEEARVAQQAFAIHKPLFVSTRDHESFERIKPFYSEVRSGIDSAFFVPRFERAACLRDQDYVTFCFDHFLEPNIRSSPQSTFEFAEEGWNLSYPERLATLASKSKGHAYLAHILDRRNYPTTWAGKDVIRPEHRTNPHLPPKIYMRPNAIASDEPWTYLSLYAGTAATLTDRVHACVATLAYGNPAYLHNPTTKRASLFDAVGAGDISRRLVRLELDVLDKAYEDLELFLREHC